MTEAIYDFWEYYEPVREYGPPDCILATQRLTNIVDNILLGKNSSMGLISELKTAFGLQDVQYVLPLIEVFQIMSAAQTIDSFPVLRISGDSTCKKDLAPNELCSSDSLADLYSKHCFGLRCSTNSIQA